MKAFGVLLVSLIVSNAHASWNLTKCSNADGSVYWSHGDDQSEINLKYSNFVEGFLTLQVEQVTIEMKDVVVLSENTMKDCAYTAHRKVFAGKVKIKASDKHPDVLRSQFPDNKIETEVICTSITYDQKTCVRE